MAKVAPAPPPPLSPEQRDTARLLRELLGNVFADRFLDFCRLSNGDTQLRVSLPLAAHALRELESSFRTTLRAPFGRDVALDEAAREQLETARDALERLGFDPNKIRDALSKLQPEPTHALQIKGIDASLGFAPDGDVIKAWLSLVARQQGVTHKRSFHERPVVDEVFREEFGRPFTVLAREIALALQRRFSTLILRVDELAADSERAKAIKRFKQEIPGTLALQRRFYERIEGPEWLEHLAREGLLRAPAPNLDDEEAGLVRWNEWPAGDYLLRMAASPNAATRDGVAAALRAVTGKDDFGLRDKCFEIAAALPAPEAAQLADAAAQWLGVRYHWSLNAPERYLHLLLKHEEGAAAIVFARALLSVEGQNGQVVTKYDRSEYEYFMPAFVEPLSNVCGFDALELFADLLVSAGKARHLIKEDPPGDYSSITSALSDENQARYDVYAALVVAVRRTAELLIHADQTRAAQIVERLTARRYHIFMRLALHAASLTPAEAGPQARDLLMNPDLLGQAWCGREYGALARAWFTQLSQDDQTILTAIDEMPARYAPIWAENFEQQQGRVPTDEENRRFVQLTRRDAMWHWREVLPATRQEEIARTVEAYGAPWGEGDARFSWEGRTEQSPATAADIAAQPIPDLVAFLKSWKPAETDESLTVSALGMEVRNAVQSNPEKFAEYADLFADVGPLYVRRIFEGLENQVNNKKVFNWSPVIRLLTAVAARADDPVSSTDVASGEDPNRLWLMSAGAALVRAGLYRSEARIPKDHAEAIWSLISNFRDKAALDIVPDDFGGQYANDPFFAVRSTLAGSALECAILFAWWAQDHGSDAEKSSAGQSLPAGVRAMLGSTLTQAVDPRLRAIVGRYFELLLYLDPAWVEQSLPNVVGASVPDEAASALWSGFLMHGRLTKNTWRYFERQFDSELKLVSEEGYDDDYRGKRFAQYLLFLYLIGEIGLEQDGLLMRFLAVADPELRQHATWYLLQDLSMDHVQLPPERRGRVRAYYEARITSAEQSDTKEKFRRELSMLGIWFGKTPADNPWVLAQLERLARARLTPQHPANLFEWLQCLVPGDADAVVTVIELILQDDGFDQWMFAAKKQEVRTILETGLRSANPETVRRTRSIANILVSRGHSDLLNIAR